MKILLIDPPFQKFIGLQKYYIPLGLLYLAGELKKKHDVVVYDADYFPEGKQLSYIEQGENYHLYTDALKNDDNEVWKEIDRVFKEVNPDVVGITLISTKLASGLKIAERLKNLGAKRIICGGAHTTINPDEVLANPFVDSIIIGESEYCFEDALTKTIVQGDRIKELDSLAFPARETLYNFQIIITRANDEINWGE